MYREQDVTTLVVQAEETRLQLVELSTQLAAARADRPQDAPPARTTGAGGGR